ncbi:polysaccharide biosynthesis/export family protein [Seohaeicola saemankumensis]|nr:polysaccharide biosynthesis/export family protein [Seohaeicola saemankumensis]MCA0872928.1 polysaccharide biosynthesis/export family protein [Seohaeicola saemankumensis]
MAKSLKRNAIGVVGLTAFMNCTSIPKPDNVEPVAQGDGYQAQYRAPSVTRGQASYLQSVGMNQQDCRAPIGGPRDASVGKITATSETALLGERLSRNDLVEVLVSNDEVFSGNFVVSRDGMLKLPYLPAIPAQGRSTTDVERDLLAALQHNEFYETAPQISVRVTDFASASVGVSGAVFEPHAVEIGGVSGDRLDTRRQAAMGSSTEGRNLAAALRAAGGVRPDADLSAVELHRGGRIHRLDMRGIFDGSDATDIMVLTGDSIVVPSRLCFQDDLMKPSPISPPGISLYLSNLTQPATGNAPSAVGREVREVPYGTRYFQAVVDTNCVGGAKTTNANRTAVLFSRNPMTDVSVVIERNLEQLLRRADRDDYDPFLLPGDAIACYDSTVTNIAEVGRVLGIVGAGLLLSSN